MPVAAPVLAPDEVVSVAVAPPDAGGLDVGKTGAEGLAVADPDDVAATLGLAVADGVAVEQGVVVAVAAFLLCVALVLAVAEAVAVALLAAVVPVVVAVLVAVVVVLVAVAVAVPLSPGLALPLAVALPWLLLEPAGGVVTGLAGGTFGVTDLAGLAAADDEEADGHAVADPLLGPAEVRPWLAAPPDEPA